MVGWETQVVYVRIENGHKRKKFKDEVFKEGERRGNQKEK